MTHGVKTAAVAQALRLELSPQGFDVLCAHGQRAVVPIGSLGQLRAWFSPTYANHTILADLDIAVVARQTGRLIALVEVEETTNKPKVLLGDVLGTLLGGQITFQVKRHWSVGEWTTLIVLAQIPSPKYRSRLAFLEQQVNQLKPHLPTPNAAIGRVVIDGFASDVDLGEMLRRHVQAAILASQTETE